MSAQEYIDEYASTLTDSEKRYILAFGPPAGFKPGPSRNPSTPSMQVADYSSASDELQEAQRRAQEAADEDDYMDAFTHGAA